LTEPRQAETAENFCFSVDLGVFIHVNSKSCKGILTQFAKEIRGTGGSGYQGIRKGGGRTKSERKTATNLIFLVAQINKDR
jgi:hypothetical protein